MKVKGNAGEHLTVLPPYGYMKSSDDKKQWVKDEEAAQVVYEVGLYIMDGLGLADCKKTDGKKNSYSGCTMRARAEQPMSQRKVLHTGFNYRLPTSWTVGVIAIGTQLISNRKSYRVRPCNRESEWKILRIPSYLDGGDADAARLARQSRLFPQKMGERMFSGMMFCADCGSIMYQCTGQPISGAIRYYLCSGYRKSRDVCGQTHSIRTVILEELVLRNLREIVSFASQRKDDFVKMLMDADMRQRNRGLAKRQKTLADAEKRITELVHHFKNGSTRILFQENFCGRFKSSPLTTRKNSMSFKVSGCPPW